MLNTPAARIDSLPPLYGGGGGMTPGGNTPASTRDHQAPRIIVGNALAGDTLDVCDYLDAGDGVQLAAALAASTTYDVWVRPGLIQLSAPLTIPTFGTLRFGSVGTVVRVGTLDRRALIMNTGARVYGLRLEVTTPAVGATGATLIQFATNCELHDCYAITSGYSTATANESLRYFVRAPTAATGALLHGLYIQPPNFQLAGLAQNMVGIGTLMSSTDNTPVRISDCTVINGDVGFELTGNALLTGCTVQAARRRGVVLSTVTPDSYKQIVSACRIFLGGATPDDCAGIEVVTGSRAGGATPIISDCIVSTSTGISAVATGIRFTGVGSGGIVTGCAIDTFPNGLTVAAGQVNVSAKGTIRGATTPVTDASGSLLNEMRVI